MDGWMLNWLTFRFLKDVSCFRFRFSPLASTDLKTLYTSDAQTLEIRLKEMNWSLFIQLHSHIPWTDLEIITIFSLWFTLLISSPMMILILKEPWISFNFLSKSFLEVSVSSYSPFNLRSSPQVFNPIFFKS